MAKNPIIDDRIILNGNKLFFLEPLEATAIGCYLNWLRLTWDWIMEGTKTATEISDDLHGYIAEVNNFITWHYQYGSKYNTPFWKAAKKITFKDSAFDDTLARAKQFSLADLLKEGDVDEYGQWSSWNFKYWNDGMTKD